MADLSLLASPELVRFFLGEAEQGRAQLAFPSGFLRFVSRASNASIRDILGSYLPLDDEEWGEGTPGSYRETLGKFPAIGLEDVDEDRRLVSEYRRLPIAYCAETWPGASPEESADLSTGFAELLWAMEHGIKLSPRARHPLLFLGSAEDLRSPSTELWEALGRDVLEIGRQLSARPLRSLRRFAEAKHSALRRMPDEVKEHFFKHGLTLCLAVAYGGLTAGLPGAVAGATLVGEGEFLYALADGDRHNRWIEERLVRRRIWL